ncbi:MAG TPA: PqqD family peptide modification chaperone, partial [Gemmatimonadaceae bacterium]
MLFAVACSVHPVAVTTRGGAMHQQPDQQRGGGNVASGTSARLVPPCHVLAATQGEETVLLDVERGRYYALNEVGSRIWSLVCEGVPFAGIVERLRAEYDVSPER